MTATNTTPANPPEKPKRKSHSAQQAKTRLIDLLNAAVFYMGTSQHFTSLLLGLREDFNLTRAEWQYLHGYFDARCDGFKFKRHYFAYVVNGEICVYDDLPQGDARKEHIHNTPSDQLESHHYWIDEKGNRTSNIWF